MLSNYLSPELLSLSRGVRAYVPCVHRVPEMKTKGQRIQEEFRGTAFKCIVSWGLASGLVLLRDRWYANSQGF